MVLKPLAKFYLFNLFGLWGQMRPGYFLDAFKNENIYVSIRNSNVVIIIIEKYNTLP